MMVHEGTHCARPADAATGSPGLAVGELVDAPPVIGRSESRAHAQHRVVACRACAIVLEREGHCAVAGQLRSKAAELEAAIAAHRWAEGVSPHRGATRIPASRRPVPAEGARRG
jgi:hypothetical protein